MRKTQFLMSSAGAFVGVSLICWIVMFLAGHDVWTFVGKPDFWKLTEAPYSDVRIFAVAFYIQFFLLAVVLVALVAAVIWQAVIMRRREFRAT